MVMRDSTKNYFLGWLALGNGIRNNSLFDSIVHVLDVKTE